MSRYLASEDPPGPTKPAKRSTPKKVAAATPVPVTGAPVIDLVQLEETIARGVVRGYFYLIGVLLILALMLGLVAGLVTLVVLIIRD